MPSNLIEVLLRLKGAREFTTQSQSAASAIKGTGTAAEQSGRKMRSGAGGLARWAAGIGVLAGGVALIKSSTSAVEDMALATLGLQRMTGMDTQTASSWVEMAKIRGVESNKLQMGFKTLDKAISNASHGGKSQIDVFKRLGVSMTDINAGRSDKVILQVASAIHGMKSPAEKAATATTLLGRSGLKLLPILDQGSDGIQKQVDLIQQYGASMGKGGVEDTKKLIAKQRELKIAMDGLKITLGTALEPILRSVAGAIATVAKFMQPLTTNATAMKIVLGALTAAFVINRIAVLAANAAFLANPIGLLVIGVTALTTGLIILYQKWRWFHNAVNNTFNWIKNHWELLVSIMLGPFTTIAHLLGLRFADIGNAAKAVYGWVRNAFTNILRFLGGIPGRVSAIGRTMWNGLVSGLHSVVNGIVDGLNTIISAVNAVGGFIGVHINPIAHWGQPQGAPTSGGGVTKIVPGKVTPSTPKTPFGIGGTPHLAAGGTLSQAGRVLVGELGPELLQLPKAARVTPLPPREPQTIRTQVFLNGRQIAEAVGAHTADKLARR